MLQWILTLSVSLLLASPSFASESVEGFIVRDGEKVLFQPQSPELKDQLWTLRGVDTAIRRDLNRLQSGDFVQGAGDINKITGDIHLDSISFVGLKKLLGLWFTQDGDVFEFEDFSRLNLYRPFQNQTSAFAFRTEQLTYKVAPDTGHQWSIFVVNGQGVDIGHLNMSPQVTTIEFIDPDSGQVSTTIRLTPVVAWKRNLH